MAVLKLDFLKTLFETYDKPTEQDFADLIDTLSTTLDIVTYSIAGSSDVWTAVNFSTKIEHKQKQLTVIYHNGKTYLFNAPIGEYGYGGISTIEENYVDLVSSQFSDSQVTAILELITKDVSVETSINITEFEQGLATTINYVADIQHADVTIISIKLNGVSKVAGVSETQVTANENITLSKNYILVIDYIRLGISMQQTYVNTVNGYIPQFAGASTTTDYDSKNISKINLSKFVQSDSDLEYNTIFSGQYSWFILSDKNKNIFDQNGLLFRDSDWDSLSAVNEYYKKKIGTIVLADGSIVSVAFFRSLNILTSDGFNFKFKSE